MLAVGILQRFLDIHARGRRRAGMEGLSTLSTAVSSPAVEAIAPTHSSLQPAPQPPGTRRAVLVRLASVGVRCDKRLGTPNESILCLNRLRCFRSRELFWR